MKCTRNELNQYWIQHCAEKHCFSANYSDSLVTSTEHWCHVRRIIRYILTLFQPNAETRNAYMELKGRSMNPLNTEAKIRINQFFHQLRLKPENGLVNLHVRLYIWSLIKRMYCPCPIFACVKCPVSLL